MTFPPTLSHHDVRLMADIFMIVWVSGVCFILMLVFLHLTWPFVSLLIRFRAHYDFKRILLPLNEDIGLSEGVEGVNDTTSGHELDRLNIDDIPEMEITSYWRLFRRVKRIEGRAGLTQGSEPYLTYGTLLWAFLVIQPFVPGASNVLRPKSFVLGIARTLVQTVIRLPFIVVTNRAATTHRHLRSMREYSTLFSMDERRNPLRLYLLKGLLKSIIALDLSYYCVVRIRGWILGELSYIRWYWIIFTAIPSDIVIAVIYCPLEFIITRLSLQKYYQEESEFINNTTLSSSHLYEIEDSREEAIPFLGSEDVITLRGEHEPYLGMLDCGKKIVNEEGWGVFWRGWFIAIMIYFVGDPGVDLPSIIYFGMKNRFRL